MSRSDRRQRFSLPGALSRPPKRAWPDGVIHHGARVLILIGLAALVAFLFPPTESVTVPASFSAGQVAAQDVLAEMAFSVPKTPMELALERDEARASTPPTFNYLPAAIDTMVARLDRFFEQVDSVAQIEGDGEVIRVLNQNSLQGGEELEQLLRDGSTRQRIRQAALQATRQVLPAGLVDAADLVEYGTENVKIRDSDTLVRTVPRSDIRIRRHLYSAAIDLLPPSTPTEVSDFLRLVLVQFTERSLEFNVRATTNDGNAAAAAVSLTGRDVLEGEAIVRANDPITPAVLQALQAYDRERRDLGRLETEVDWTAVFGAGLLNLLVLSVFGVLLFFFRPEVYANARWVALIAILVGSYFASAALIGSDGLPYELLPITFVALIVAVLWDGRLALVLALILAVLTGVQAPFADRSVAVVATILIAGAAAGLSVRAIRRRAQLLVVGAIVAGAYGLVILSLTLLDLAQANQILPAVGNALLSAILAIGFLPVCEWFTGITTDQTLLEWADPNRALLRRLSMEAPGTYAHTINVANLAESAAGSVGANGLLCRVGLYYHDVGKVLKPHYFVENQPGGRNPHDRLKPDTSAAIVKEHVTEGSRLAREAKVPAVVAAFIPEHHGTSWIGFFWEKALEEYGDEALDEQDFRYPGPKPQSRETAIAMLADSVESATRALQDPTIERVKELIHSIVSGKISDGQLDETPLTLGDIAKVEEQFIKVLSGIYHHRIDYPRTKHLTESPSDAEVEGPSEEEVDTESDSEKAVTVEAPELALGDGAEGAEKNAGREGEPEPSS